jgi:hypothetical protein
MRKGIFLVVVAVTLALLGCSNTIKNIKEPHRAKEKKMETRVKITGKLFISPVEDYTAGRMLSDAVAQDIYGGVSERIKKSGKYELTNNKLLASYIIKIKIIEIARGSRAVPFWVGAVSSPARLIFSCDILDASGKVIETLNYHTVERGFSRISDKEISYFKELTIDKISEWLRVSKP